MRKVILLVLFWCMIIVSVTAQISDRFIYWLNPDAISLIDERMTYTFVPMLVNYFVLFLLWKTKIQKPLICFSLLLNTVLFLYYIYYQFGDMGLGKFR